MSKLLAKAEGLFGPVQSSYSFNGVTFFGEKPRIYYQPPTGISICLTPAALNNEIQAYHQLAHEVIHLLSPTGRSVASNFEEGLACLFSSLIANELFGGAGSIYTIQSLHGTNYNEPWQKVTALYNQDSSLIKNLRAINPFLSNLTPSDFSALSHSLDADTIDYLIKPMVY